MPQLTFNDTTRTALLTFARLLFPVLILYGIHNFTDNQIVATVALIEAALTLLASVFKQGQAAGPDVAAKMQRALQFNREQLELLPDNVLALMRPIGWEGTTREELIATLTAAPK